MTKKDEIVNKLEQLFSIPAMRAALQLNSNTVERAYEAYVFGLCKKAVIEAGGTADMIGIQTGINPNPLVFRGAPGNLASTAQDYCYINCALKDKRFEIHLDVQYEGTAGASHEIDVSIYEHDAAEAVRESNRLPKTGKLRMIFECKFYLKSVPGTELARSFVGLVADCPSTLFNAFISNQASDNLKKYFTNKNKLEPFVDLEPSNKNVENRFVSNIEQKLIKWVG